MNIWFVPQFGVISDNKIIYDENRLKNTVKICDCSLYIGSSDLKLNFEFERGRILGFEGKVGEIVNLIKGQINMSQYFEGEISACTNLKFISGANYIINIEEAVIYDEHEKMLLFGRDKDAQLAVKVAENLFILLTDDKICGIIVSDII